MINLPVQGQRPGDMANRGGSDSTMITQFSVKCKIMVTRLPRMWFPLSVRRLVGCGRRLAAKHTIDATTGTSGPGPNHKDPFLSQGDRCRRHASATLAHTDRDHRLSTLWPASRRATSPRHHGHGEDTGPNHKELCSRRRLHTAAVATPLRRWRTPTATTAYLRCGRRL